MIKKILSVIIIVLVIANIGLAYSYLTYKPDPIRIPCKHEFLPVTAFLQEDGTVQCLFGRIIDV